jgi:hypothetical protein
MVNPIDVISPTRLDVFTKLDFARGVITGEGLSWGRNLYREYMSASAPTNKFDEDGIKFSLDDYENSFVSLIASMKENGFLTDLGSVPIGKLGITNGAHRLASALALGVTIETNTTGDIDQIYDLRFLRRIGMHYDSINYISWRYLQHSIRQRAFLLTAINPEDSKKIVKEIGSRFPITGLSKVELSEIGKRRLMGLAYGHNSWWLPQFSESMVAERFNQDVEDCTLVLFDSDMSDLTEFKSELRSNLSGKLFERQIHGTDAYSDTVSLAEVLLNRNGINFMNNSPLGSETRLMASIKSRIYQNRIIEEIRDCIDGSSVLELYGIREARDLDYITSGNYLSEYASIGSCHNGEYPGYSEIPTDIIFDPRKHFIFKGHKFISLSTFCGIKHYVDDLKARADLKLIMSMTSFTTPLYHSGVDVRNARKWRVAFIINSQLSSFLSLLPDKLEKQLRTIISKLRSKYTSF